MTTETQALEGRFTHDGIHSAFGFSVVHLLGSLDDVGAGGQGRLDPSAPA